MFNNVFLFQVLGGGGFNISGLKLQGAVVQQNQLHLTATIMTELPLVQLQWARTTGEQHGAMRWNLIFELNVHNEYNFSEVSPISD